MLELHEEVDGQILVADLSGKLTAEDYKRFVPIVERMIEEHGKVRILCPMHDFHGWDLGALWEDIKFDFKHFADIERLALVGHGKWQTGMAVFCKPFTTAKVRHFKEHELREAEEWIWADLPQAVGKRAGHVHSVRYDRVQEASEESFPASDAPAY